MTATMQYRAALKAQNASKSLYEIRILPNGPRDFEWRLYFQMTAIVAAGCATSATAAQREARAALRIRIEYPEHFTNEKAAA